MQPGAKELIYSYIHSYNNENNNNNEYNNKNKDRNSLDDTFSSNISSDFNNNTDSFNNNNINEAELMQISLNIETVIGTEQRLLTKEDDELLLELVLDS